MYLDELHSELQVLRELIESKRLEVSDADRARYDALVALDSEIDLAYCAGEGAVAIPESDFEDHARDLAEDIGAIASDNSWPIYCIDWEQAARELQMDYSSFTLDGITYYTRP